MTTTLNHYNKKNKRRTKTQRKQKNGGRMRKYFDPGNVYYFNKRNMHELDRLMQTQVPTIFRHSTNDCPHCKKFEKPWSVIEEITQHPSQSHSVASLDPIATEYIVNNYPEYPRVNGFPTVVLVNKDGVPIEHTGPNTLESIEQWLNEHGMKIKIVPIDDEADALNNVGNDDAGLGAGLGAAGLGAGLGAAGFEPSEASVDPESSLSVPGSLSSEAFEASVAPEAPADFVAPEAPADFVAPEAPADFVAPEAPAEPSSTLEKVKATVSEIDNNIKSGVEALTKSIDFNKIFGKADTDANADAFPNAPEVAPAPGLPPAPAPAPEEVNTPPPQVPSNGGRRKKGKKSRRKEKRSSKRTRSKTRRTRRTKKTM